MLEASGIVTLLTDFGSADSYVASAQQPGAGSPLESTLYLVRRGAPGVRTAGPFDDSDIVH